jgi:RNA-directed DNA polymerase
MDETKSGKSTETKLLRISKLSSEDSKMKFRWLMPHFNKDTLIRCFNELSGRKAVGIDGKTKDEYGIRLEENKTKVVPFKKRNFDKGIKQGTFDFLGFKFYIARSRKGGVTVKLRTNSKRSRTKLKNMKTWIMKYRHTYKLKDLWMKFCIKLNGHIRYYSVSFNYDSVSAFMQKAVKIFFKWINRRSQRKSITWDKFNKFILKYPLPKIIIYHSLF